MSPSEGNVCSLQEIVLPENNAHRDDEEADKGLTRRRVVEQLEALLVSPERRAELKVVSCGHRKCAQFRGYSAAFCPRFKADAVGSSRVETFRNRAYVD